MAYLTASAQVILALMSPHKTMPAAVEPVG